jgi:hypothetical protein
VTSRKQHAYEVLLRMAHVKELQANAALAEAAAAQEQCRQLVDEVSAAWQIVLSAGLSCAEGGRDIDIARYQLLRELGQAISSKLDAANEKLNDAALRYKKVALENVTAKRYRERVGEALATVKESRMRTVAAKTQEESAELWAVSRGGVA